MSIQEDVVKQRLLEEAGYRYSIKRMAFINRTTKKIFSIEALRDHSEEWVREKVRERTDGDWRFYFNEVPSPAIRREYVAELDGQHAIR